MNPAEYCIKLHSKYRNTYYCNPPPLVAPPKSKLLGASQYLESITYHQQLNWDNSATSTHITCELETRFQGVNTTIQKDFQKALDNVSAIILNFPLICLISRLNPCKKIDHLSILLLFPLHLFIKVKGLLSVKIKMGKFELFT